MRWFRRKKAVVTDEATAKKIAGYILEYQRRLADYLNSKAKCLSGKALLMMLVMFGVGLGGYCLYLLMRAFS